MATDAAESRRRELSEIRQELGRIRALVLRLQELLDGDYDD